MALFRHVRTEFWKDPRVLEEMTPEDKLFFLYLLTNSSTTQIGIYKIPKKQIAFELGYSVESIDSLIDRFEKYYQIIKYNIKTREIAIKNWGKYNLNKGGKPIMDCIKKELVEVKDKTLIEYVALNITKLDIKKEFYDSYNDTLDNSYTIGTQKEKEKEKQKEEEKEKEILICSNNVGRFKLLYEKNVGLINAIVAQWLIDVSENIDYELFKKAIEIATDRGKCNKGYINGILKQWYESNIKSIEDLNAYQVSVKNRGDSNYGKNECEYSKSKYARALENEDASLYRKPTDEEIEAVRREFESFNK